MAEIVLSPLLQVVFEKLANPFLKEIADRFGIRKEVQKLVRTLLLIQVVLEDAEEQQSIDRALRLWLAELKEVAYDIEDLLDEFAPEAVQSRNHGGVFEQVRNIVPSLVQVADYVDFLPRLKQIKETLVLLAEEKSSFNLRESVTNRYGISRRTGKRQTGSSVIQSEVFGRKEDKDKIVDQLLSSNGVTLTHGSISVISIVGLGGLGKTTLAQLVYNNERVSKHFDMKIWVCVDDDFDVTKIMISIIESASKKKCDFLGMDVLQLRLQELLFGKRFLLVLDDVWNEDENEWEKLRMSLISGVDGSRIIATTRSKKVALIMGSSYTNHLEGLSDDDCWRLFKQRAFGLSEREHSNLFPIGRQIVKKCGGVPLAAKTLGSLMRFKKEEREWLLVQESDFWDVSDSGNGILPALRLSYSHLPSHLKACFAYCSIFPKNYIIKKEKLIRLWIAEALIQSPEGKKSLEFIGNEYFDDLVWIFFFQDIQKCENDNIVECKMHDLIHDLAISVAGSEFKMLEHENTQDLSEIRHSSVVCNFSLYTIPEALYAARKLRTLILLHPKGDLGEVPLAVFSSFRYLRVLDLSGSGIKKLNEAVSCFIFLRYLDLSSNHIEALPESVCCLCNLQVLNLSGCYNLMELPSNMAKMKKLKQLIMDDCERLTEMPACIGELTHLRTLSMFIVGEAVGQHLNQLKYLNLGGDLNIRHLENVRDEAEAREADLIGKRSLQSLSLSWGNNSHCPNENFACDGTREAVLKYLQPHRYLKKLSIRGYQGICFPEWMNVDKLPNITELVLINCRRCENLPPLGQLCFLKVLYLQGMDAVKSIGIEFYGKDTERPLFPSLKELTLTEFPRLEFWWSSRSREEFPSLVKLTINKCFRLHNSPCFKSLQHLELHSCNNIILRSFSNLTSLNTLVIDEFADQLMFLEDLLQNNALLMYLKFSSCPKLYSIPPSFGRLTNLKSLAIQWCAQLHSLPQGLKNLTSLESLEIIECHGLVSLPEDIQGLCSLRSLSIENCSNLKSLPLELQFLKALEHLTIMYCPNLAPLPDSLQHLSALKSLSILNCPELTTLPEGLQFISTLQNLEIRGCPGLVALPNWVQKLTSLRSLSLSDCCSLTRIPDGLQLLTSLQHLSILECPNLEERCKRDTGEDWPKLSHVAHVYVGSREFASTSSR